MLVLLDWREYRHSAEWPWGELCDQLHGAGVPNADEALKKLRLRPLHESLRLAVQQGKALLETKEVSVDDAAKVQGFIDACEKFYVLAGEAAGVKRLGLLPMVAGEVAAERKRAITLPAKDEKEWTQAAAWMVLRGLKTEVFDQLLLREALGEIFAEEGFQGEDAWRAAARVRLLLNFAGSEDALHVKAFWDEADARWLASVNEAGGKTYFNKEAFEESGELDANAGVAGRQVECVASRRRIEGAKR